MKREGIYYERSGAFGNYHFEIYATPDEAETISDWLDVLSIQEGTRPKYRKEVYT